jgi:hypothetical protein
MIRSFVLVVVVALVMPATTFAQKADSPPRWTISPRTGPASAGWPRDPLPRFTIPPRGTVGLPLPEIGLPLPPIGLQPPHGSRRGQGRYHWPGKSYGWPVVIYYAPWYEPVVPVREAAPAPDPVEQPKPTGRLILDAQPENAQIFVDGYYAGVPDDFSAARGGGVIEAGPHRIDITAPGYEAIVFDVRIAPSQSVTYRGTMKKIPAAPAPNGPTTFYLIPGCYMGNVPPKDARLPATCDLGRAVEFKY